MNVCVTKHHLESHGIDDGSPRTYYRKQPHVTTRLSLLLADPHYRRRSRSISILGNSSPVRVRDATDRFSLAEHHRRVTTRIFGFLSLPLSISPSPFPRNLTGLTSSAKMLEPEVGAKIVNLRRGTSLRIPSMSDPTEGKDQTRDKRDLYSKGLSKLRNFVNRDAIFLNNGRFFMVVIALALIQFSFYVHHK